jgi:hypothetical protein
MRRVALRCPIALASRASPSSPLVTCILSRLHPWGMPSDRCRSEIAAALALSLRSTETSPTAAAPRDGGQPMDAVAEVEAWLALDQRMQDRRLLDGIGATTPVPQRAAAAERAAVVSVETEEREKEERERSEIAAAMALSLRSPAMSPIAAAPPAEAAVAAVAAAVQIEERERRRRDMVAAVEQRAAEAVAGKAAAAAEEAAVKTATSRRRVTAALIIQRRWRRRLLWRRAEAATAHAYRVAAAAGVVRGPTGVFHRGTPGLHMPSESRIAQQPRYPSQSVPPPGLC